MLGPSFLKSIITQSCETPVDNEDKWESRYGFPPIILLVGKEHLTDNIVYELEMSVNKNNTCMEFKHMTMSEFVYNNNKPFTAPKGENGGIIILKYQSGLTDLSIYDLSSGILMKKYDTQDSVYNGLNVDQNWRDEEFHRKGLHIMPWIRSGWNLIVVADEHHYNPIMDCSKGFSDQIYIDLSKCQKWHEIRAFNID